MSDLAAEVPRRLEEIQASMFRSAKVFRDEHTFRPDSYGELSEILSGARGFVEAPWCSGPDCEAKVKDDTKATIRVLPMDPEDPGANCIVCGKRADENAVWAQAY